MGNGNSSVCTGINAPGLNSICFSFGFDHGSDLTNGESLDTAPCTTNPNANICYAQGYVAGNYSQYPNLMISQQRK